MTNRQLLRSTIIPLAIGALSAALLLSFYAMFWYEIPVGGDPHWIVEPEDFIKAFPVVLIFTSVYYLLCGPIFYILLRKFKLFTWWGTTVAGGLMAFILSLIFSGSFDVLVDPFYFLVGACSALLSFLSYMRSNKLVEQSEVNSGSTSR